MRRKKDPRLDDMEGIAQRLRCERPQATPLELDRIRASAIARARAVAAPTRVGARRLAVAGVTLGVLAASTGGVLAAGGGSPSPGNAAVAQYGNNCNANNTGDHNSYNCNENSFNTTNVTNITNNTVNNYGSSNVTNNYTTVTSPSPSSGVLGTSASKPTTSDRKIKIHVDVPRGAKVSRVTVKVNGKRLKTVRGKRASGNVELENLPCGNGTTTVVVTVTLTDGKTVSARHTYHLCT